ncbi:MAG: hypothetical protein AAF211_05860 [Myxococcota bacterium]
MRAWLALILCSVGCSTTPEVDDPGTDSPPLEPLPSDAELILRREGEIELRGTEWTGTERLRLIDDDLFEPTDLCVITYTVTGTTPRTDCADCNASPEGDGGAHEFLTAAATVEAELNAGACDIILGAETVAAASLEDLNGRTLVYGWGEEATGHGYSLFALNDQGEWFDLVLMDNPFENVGGVLDERGVDAYLAYFVFEGSFAQ